MPCLRLKDQERNILVDMYREQNKTVIESTVTERCEQLKKQLTFAENDSEQYKKRIEVITQERNRAYDEIEVRLQQERTRVRTEQESRYHTLQEKNSELQNRLHTLEVVYTKQNEEEIKQRRVEFDTQLDQWFHKVTV